MTGAHRSKGDLSLLDLAKTADGRKTLGVLTALGVACAVFLALAGPAIYLALRHLGNALDLLIASQSLLWIGSAGQLAGNLRRGRTRSPEDLVTRLGLAAWLTGSTAVLLSAIGRQQGWMHGITEYVLVSICALFLAGMPVSWLGGKRRLVASLTARQGTT